MKAFLKKIVSLLWVAFGITYIPAYIAFWLLHKVARLLLAISYFGMFEWGMGKDIISSLFKWHGRL